MNWFVVYVVTGVMLIGQSVLRRWRYSRPRGLEGCAMMVGFVALWPVALVVDAYVWFQERRVSLNEGSED